HHRFEFGERGEIQGPGPGVNLPGGGFLPHMMVVDGHGVVGVVQSVSPSGFVIASRDGSTETIGFASTTLIRNDGGNASSSVLSPGQTVVVIGTPTRQGSVDARFIRILPSAPMPAPGH